MGGDCCRLDEATATKVMPSSLLHHPIPCVLYARAAHSIAHHRTRSERDGANLGGTSFVFIHSRLEPGTGTGWAVLLLHAAQKNTRSAPLHLLEISKIHTALCAHREVNKLSLSLSRRHEIRCRAVGSQNKQPRKPGPAPTHNGSICTVELFVLCSTPEYLSTTSLAFVSVQASALAPCTCTPNSGRPNTQHYNISIVSHLVQGSV